MITSSTILNSYNTITNHITFICAVSRITSGLQLDKVKPLFRTLLLNNFTRYFLIKEKFKKFNWTLVKTWSFKRNFEKFNFSLFLRLLIMLVIRYSKFPGLYIMLDVSCRHHSPHRLIYLQVSRSHVPVVTKISQRLQFSCLHSRKMVERHDCPFSITTFFEKWKKSLEKVLRYFALGNKIISPTRFSFKAGLLNKII